MTLDLNTVFSGLSTFFLLMLYKDFRGYMRRTERLEKIHLNHHPEDFEKLT